MPKHVQQGSIGKSLSSRLLTELEQKEYGDAIPIHLSPLDANETRRGNECAENLSVTFEELVEILDIELDQYRDLIGLFRAQRESFASGDVSSFEEISKRQETVVLKIKTLEEARKTAVARLARCFGVASADASELTLAELAAALAEVNADAPIRLYSDLCMAYREEILSIIRELENLKESNAYLIQHALHHVSGVLRIFASTYATDPSYSKGGQIKRNLKKGKYVSGWG